MERIDGRSDGAGLRVGLVAARFNDLIVDRLLDGALLALRSHGVSDDDVVVVRVPGAVEVPLLAQALADRDDIDAVVALGCVIRGSTSHYDHVCQIVASGVARIALDASKPVIFGVLTTETLEQAFDRAGGKLGNKGAEAATAAIQTASALNAVRSLA
jgi:6,7-dimethyl-8-ribityllumazine synthase